MGIFGKELVIKLAIIHILFIRTFNGFPHLSSSPLNEEKLSFHDENKEHRPTDEADKVSGSLPSEFIGQIFETFTKGDLINTLMGYFRNRTPISTDDPYNDQKIMKISRSNRRAEKDTQYFPTYSERKFDDPPDDSSRVDILPSIDSVPTEKEVELPPSIAISDFGKEWKKALFGKGGILTEIFNFVNDKRKDGLNKVAKAQADALPKSDKAADFIRIIEALLKKSEKGDFDEPLPEIPFIGICNRVNCGDIYKAIDEFRKSEFFTNFQTALSLMHDPKGWDVIGELLANPELIENFTGSESFHEIFSPKSTNSSEKNNIVAIGKSEDGNIGIDFSSVAEEGAVRPADLKKDKTFGQSETPDYYSFADKSDVKSNPENDGRENMIVPRKILSQKSESEVMPEFAEFIDEFPDTVDRSETIAVEKIERTNSTMNATKLSDLEAKSGLMTAEKNKNNDKVNRTQKIIRITTEIPTTKNFRADSDYYSFYY